MGPPYAHASRRIGQNKQCYYDHAGIRRMAWGQIGGNSLSSTLMPPEGLRLHAHMNHCQQWDEANSIQYIAVHNVVTTHTQGMLLSRRVLSALEFRK